jgi:glycine/D-amino acid oxidase-like deaminating enzyme/nitrite reductase/ring-hydroxylating ferredoxin subunit
MRESVWSATAEAQRYPTLEADLEVDVAVVGGGWVGLTTALLAQRDGARVAVLEGAQVGAGTTGYTTGKVTSQHSLIYADLIGRHGHEVARSYAEANQAGVEKAAALVDELGIDCELTRAPAYTYTRLPDRRAEIEAEVEAATRLGLPAALTDTMDLPFDIEAAVRFDNQLHVHPGRFLAGIAAAVTTGGGLVLEQTRVTAVDEQRDRTVELTTPAARVRANQVVVATLLPLGVIGGYFAKTRPSRSYALAARLATAAPTSMAISIDSPTRSTRPWLTPGPNGLVVCGNGHETGEDVDTEARYADLEEWTRSTFDVEAIDYRWSAQDYATPDRLPYVGRSPMSHMVFVATGFHKWGLSNGTAAALMLADLLAGRDNAWLPTFDATRIGDAKAIGELIKDNLKVGKERIGGRIARAGSIPAAELEPGHGGLVDLDGETVGAYRDPDGELQAVRPICTHLGCSLRWNQAETSWDCNCHGSRFDSDGSILNGPAVEPLERTGQSTEA